MGGFSEEDGGGAGEILGLVAAELREELGWQMAEIGEEIGEMDWAWEEMVAFRESAEAVELRLEVMEDIVRKCDEMAQMMREDVEMAREQLRRWEWRAVW